MAVTNALESRVFTSIVSKFTCGELGLGLGLDDMENWEQIRLTNYAAWKSSRSRIGDFRKLVESGWRPALLVEALPP